MEQREFARRVTAAQGSLYRVAASYLRGESDRLDAVAEAIARVKGLTSDEVARITLENGKRFFGIKGGEPNEAP